MASIKQQLETVLSGTDLTFDQAHSVLDLVFEGDIDPTQIAAFLTALRMKGETFDEIAGLASSLRSHAIRVSPGVENLVDTCGTGGAQLKTFNISTAAAIVAAGAGVKVAKHGNRAITSKCGSADVLMSLGVNIEPGVKKVEQCIGECGIGFIFAPKFHPAMKYVQPIRKALEFRTVFNMLGPLANPAFASRQVLGVAAEPLMEKMLHTLKRMGSEKVMVVHSDGLDEISTMGVTKVLELDKDSIKSYELDPEQFGFKKAVIDDLTGDDPDTNANIIKAILDGSEIGPKLDIVLLNSAASIKIAGLAGDFSSAIDLARDSVAAGKAEAVLKKLVEISNS